MPIPEFRTDGYLPEGVHQATEAEVLFRSGSATPCRRYLALRQELFAAEDEEDWAGWIEFLTRTREADGRRKGVVEIVL